MLDRLNCMKGGKWTATGKGDNDGQGDASLPYSMPALIVVGLCRIHVLIHLKPKRTPHFKNEFSTGREKSRKDHINIPNSTFWVIWTTIYSYLYTKIFLWNLGRYVDQCDLNTIDKFFLFLYTYCSTLLQWFLMQPKLLW